MATYKCRDCSHEIISDLSPSECEICGSPKIILLENTRLVSEVDDLKTLHSKVSMQVKFLSSDKIFQETRGEYKTSLTLTRTVNLKVVVTPTWKKEVQDKLLHQLSQKLELEQRQQIQEQLKNLQHFEFGQEVDQGQIESLFHVSIGDNLISKMQVEVLLNDGIVQEIRGAGT